jgi:hypothetical protein
LSSERYQPTGRPLTDEQREVLTVLVEECAEVIQAATKLLRFGIENYPPDGPLAGAKNSVILAYECGDLRYMLDLCERNLIDRDSVDLGYKRKKERFAYYRQSKPDA